jgi:hypothetical protein
MEENSIGSYVGVILLKEKGGKGVEEKISKKERVR